jgi:hypothetical protein
MKGTPVPNGVPQIRTLLAIEAYAARPCRSTPLTAGPDTLGQVGPAADNSVTVSSSSVTKRWLRSVRTR